MRDVFWVQNRTWDDEVMVEAWSIITQENAMGAGTDKGTTNLGDISR
jgi:hypothetical protein